MKLIKLLCAQRANDAVFKLCICIYAGDQTQCPIKQQQKTIQISTLSQQVQQINKRGLLAAKIFFCGLLCLVYCVHLNRLFIIFF